MRLTPRIAPTLLRGDKMTLWSDILIDPEDDDEETLSKYRDECGDDTEDDESESWEEDDDLENLM